MKIFSINFHFSILFRQVVHIREYDKAYYKPPNVGVLYITVFAGNKLYALVAWQLRCNTISLTHWGRDKMAANVETTFSYVFLKENM